MENIVLLEWSFTPKDYFEDEIRIEREDYEMIIKSGVVEARIDSDVYDEEHEMRDTLHKNLNARFSGVQLLTHKPYNLSNSSMCRLHPDGRKDVTVLSKPCVRTVSDGNADIVVKDKEGFVVSDSRRDRIEKRKELSELAETYSEDPIVASMLKSYKAAVNNPENELVHLYEIRDALAKYFSGEGPARKALGLGAHEWSRLGQLANSQVGWAGFSCPRGM